MTLTDQIVKNIIIRVIKSQDYRIEVVNLINAEFLQCDRLGVNWVALRDKDGYKKFGEILQKLNIPHTNYKGNLDVNLPVILEELF
jgi:hypothetical protein